MEILATARHEMGGEFKLVKVSDDFFMYGTQQEFESFWGVSALFAVAVLEFWVVRFRPLPFLELSRYEK